MKTNTQFDGLPFQQDFLAEMNDPKMHLIEEESLDQSENENRLDKHIERLAKHLELLGKSVHTFETFKMVEVDRNGLGVMEKWYLQQFHSYLQGLLHTVIMTKLPNHQAIAMSYFFKSVRITENVCNQTCKKALVQMANIMWRKWIDKKRLE